MKKEATVDGVRLVDDGCEEDDCKRRNKKTARRRSEGRLFEICGEAKFDFGTFQRITLDNIV